MKAVRLLAVVLCLCAIVAPGFAGDDAHATKPISNAAFDRVKTLTGNWSGKYVGPGGSFTGAASFKVVSGGSSVMLTMDEGKGDEMITMFHPDGHDALMMTHYCSGQNQPRMRLKGITDPNKLVFDFVDGTNLAGEYMTKLVITIVDADHHSEDWTYDNHGKQEVAHFDFTRVKS